MAGEHSNFVDELREQARIANMWAHQYPKEAVQVAENLLQGGAYQTPMPSQVTENIEAQQRIVQANQALQQMAMQQAQNQAMQQQTLLGQQAMFQNQMQLQAFSQMIPGAQSPAFNLGISNAQALQQHATLMAAQQMNPYIAGALSSRELQRNLVDAQYMTSPRFGIFREAPRGFGPEPLGGRGIGWDIATVMGARSMALYEDPFMATMEARRRLFRRTEAIAGAGVSALGTTAGIVGGLMMGGIPGAIAGMALEPVIDLTAGQYFQRRAQAQRVQEITRPLVTGGETGPAGAGLPYRAAAELTREMRRFAAESPFFNIQDVEGILNASAQSGMLNFVSRKDDIMKAIKQQAEMLHVFMRITGDPDLQAAFERMARFQTLGVGAGQQAGLLNRVQAFSRMAGVGVQEMLQTGFALGAQQAANIGAAPVMGGQLGMMAQGMVRVAEQQGLFNPLEMAIRGGPTGMAQNVGGLTTSFIHRQLGLNLAAFLKPGEGGQFQVNQEALNRYLSGQTTSQQVLGQAMNNLQQWGPQGMGEFFLQRRDLLAQIEAGLSPAQQIQFIRRGVGGIREMAGGAISERQAYQVAFGDQWREMMTMTGPENTRAVARQMDQQIARMRFSEEERIRTQNRWYHRLATSIATGYNEAVEGVMGGYLLDRAEAQQEAEAKAVGGIYVKGLGSPMSKDLTNKALAMWNKDLESKLALTEEERYRANEKLVKYADKNNFASVKEAYDSINNAAESFRNVKTQDTDKALETIEAALPEKERGKFRARREAMVTSLSQWFGEFGTDLNSKLMEEHVAGEFRAHLDQFDIDKMGTEDRKRIINLMSTEALKKLRYQDYTRYEAATLGMSKQAEITSAQPTANLKALRDKAEGQIQALMQTMIFGDYREGRDFFTGKDIRKEMVRDKTRGLPEQIFELSNLMKGDLSALERFVKAPEDKAYEYVKDLTKEQLDTAKKVRERIRGFGLEKIEEAGGFQKFLSPFREYVAAQEHARQQAVQTFGRGEVFFEGGKAGELQQLIKDRDELIGKQGEKAIDTKEVTTIDKKVTYMAQLKFMDLADAVLTALNNSGGRFA